MRAPRNRARAALLGAAAGAVLAGVIYAAFAGSRSTGSQAAAAPVHVDFVDTIPEGPLVLFRNASPGALYGRLAIVHLPLPEQTRLIAPLSCERVHYAAGWGVCMVTDETRLPVRHEAYVFDRSFARGPAIPLTGPPTRARVSPDGRRVALTVFEEGHSYADAGFSTRTIVVETATSRTLGNLEDFAVQRDGVPFKAADFNFWGVTFANDGDRFFATLKTGGERYLIEGSVDARQATVVRTDVECPSLSPDESRLVFKKPLPRGIGWQLHVLELATGAEHPLNQVRRSVDDQVDWFDDTHVIYHDSASEGTGLWMLSIDGVTPPQLIVPNAYSPSVRRYQPSGQ